MTVDRSVLFGVPIDGYTMTQTLDVIDECIRNGRAQGRSYQVTTVNVDFLVNAIDDPEVIAMLQQADLNLADGMPLLWASHLLGTPLPERVAGADLVPLLAAESAARGWRVHLFGAGPGVAQRARDKMLEAHPDALITADGGPSAIDVRVPDESVIESIRSINPDVLCVALGNPKQERFIASYREALQCPVMIGIGGSLDMLVGDKKRAPRWAQRIGAEWVFRAAQEPGRLGRRYAHDLRVFGPAVNRYWRALRQYRTLQPDGLEVSDNREILWATTSRASRSADPSGPCEMNFDGVDGLDPKAHALVVSMLREARLQEIAVVANNISTALRACFEDYRTWPLLAPHVGVDVPPPPPTEPRSRESLKIPASDST